MMGDQQSRVAAWACCHGIEYRSSFTVNLTEAGILGAHTQPDTAAGPIM